MKFMIFLYEVEHYDHKKSTYGEQPLENRTIFNITISTYPHLLYKSCKHTETLMRGQRVSVLLISLLESSLLKHSCFFEWGAPDLLIVIHHVTM